MYNFFKRLLDISVSFLAILILVPLLLPIIIILRFSSEGYVFYLQDRIGKNKKIFKIIKFPKIIKAAPKNKLKVQTKFSNIVETPRAIKGMIIAT